MRRPLCCSQSVTVASGKSRADSDEFAVDRAFRSALTTDQCAGCTGKVFGVSRDVKTNDVATEKTLEDLLTPGKDGENIVAWEWCVVEESDFEIRALGTDEAWSQPEVVVMNPDDGAVGGFWQAASAKR